MRKLCIDDMYLLSEIADKIEFEMPDVKGKTQEQLGGELILQLFKKMHKAKHEINQLIESVSGKNVNELSLAEVKNTILDIFKQDGTFDFFK